MSSSVKKLEPNSYRVGWWFLPPDNPYGPFTPPDFVPTIYEGRLDPSAEDALPAHRDLLSALSNAKSPTLGRVYLTGEILSLQEERKSVGRRRIIVWRRDVSKELDKFARLALLDAHDMVEFTGPEVQYLETGRDDLKELIAPWVTQAKITALKKVETSLNGRANLAIREAMAILVSPEDVWIQAAQISKKICRAFALSTYTCGEMAEKYYDTFNHLQRRLIKLVIGS